MIYIIQNEHGDALTPTGEWAAPGADGTVLVCRHRETADGAAAHHGGRVVEVEEPPPLPRMPV